MDHAFEPVEGIVVRLTILAMGLSRRSRDAKRDLFSRVLVISVELRALAPIFGPKMRLLGTRCRYQRGSYPHPLEPSVT